MRPKKDIKQKDIADRLGISSVTVSNALSGRKGVSRQLREKIISAAEEMGYDIYETQTPRMPKGLSSGKILILFPEGERICDIPEGEKKNISEVCEARNLCAEFLPWSVSRERRQQDQISLLRKEGSTSDCVGIIFWGRLPEEKLLENVRWLKKPMAGVECFSASFDIDYIVDDTFHGGYLMAKCMTEAGVQRIIPVLPTKQGVFCPDKERAMKDRLLGCSYQQYLDKLYMAEKMEEVPAFDIIQPDDGIYLEEAVRIAEQAEKDKVRTGFFCPESRTVLRLLELLQGKINCMENVLVGGFETGTVISAEEMAALKKCKVLMYKNDTKQLYELAIKILLFLAADHRRIEGVHPVLGQVYQIS